MWEQFKNTTNSAKFSCAKWLKGLGMLLSEEHIFRKTRIISTITALSLVYCKIDTGICRSLKKMLRKTGGDDAVSRKLVKTYNRDKYSKEHWKGFTCKVSVVFCFQCCSLFTSQIHFVCLLMWRPHFVSDLKETEKGHARSLDCTRKGRMTTSTAG